MQGFLLQVDVAEIVMHEAYDPGAVIDLLDADTLAGEHIRDADLLAMQKDAKTVRRLTQDQAVLAAFNASATPNFVVPTGVDMRTPFQTGIGRLSHFSFGDGMRPGKRTSLAAQPRLGVLLGLSTRRIVRA